MLLLRPFTSAKSWTIANERGYHRLANKLFLKVADLAALAADYYKAIENYEKVAKSSVSNNLMKWSVKDYFLKAGICHLATTEYVPPFFPSPHFSPPPPFNQPSQLTPFPPHSMVALSRALSSYRDLDPTFASTREHQLLVDLSEAVEAGDQEAYTDKLFQYDQLSKLDKWKTELLLRIKNGIEEKGEDFS